MLSNTPPSPLEGSGVCACAGRDSGEPPVSAGTSPGGSDDEGEERRVRVEETPVYVEDCEDDEEEEEGTEELEEVPTRCSLSSPKISTHSNVKPSS